MPEQGSNGANGFDVFARVIQDETRRDPNNGNLRLPLWELMGSDGTGASYQLKPGRSILVGIGCVFEMPPYMGCLMIARSGQTTKTQPLPLWEVVNSPSFIDADFRGEAAVHIRNISRQTMTITAGMKIAQILFTPTFIPQFVMVNSLSELSPTARGGNGLGSTGMGMVANEILPKTRIRRQKKT